MAIEFGSGTQKTVHFLISLALFFLGAYLLGRGIRQIWGDSALLVYQGIVLLYLGFNGVQNHDS